MTTTDEFMNALADNLARNVAETNARLTAEGRCIMHNSNVTIPARYLLEVPIGNVLPLCADCCEWWQADAKDTDDPMTQPVRITEVRAAQRGESTR